MEVAELVLAGEGAAIEAQSPKLCLSLHIVTDCYRRRRAFSHSGTAALSGCMLQQQWLAVSFDPVACMRSSPADPA